MNKKKKIDLIRKKLKSSTLSLGSWMQIPSSSIAEIIGDIGFDWVAIDMEHGSISVNQLPDIFRALELGNTLPLVRVAQGNAKECKEALDAGAGGVIVPNVQDCEELKETIDYCRFPPAGKRGVAYSRANLFGQNFRAYCKEAQNPIIVAMIESIKAVQNLEEILDAKGIDAILIGPYDLSASIGITGDFKNTEYKKILNKILNLCKKKNIPAGIHSVNPTVSEIKKIINDDYKFIACSMDAIMLRKSAMELFSLFKSKI